MKLREVILRKVSLPLIRPYVLSYRTFDEFEPIIVEVRDSDGRVGWGEGHISPGSSRETREGGWAFCCEHATAVVDKDTKEAKSIAGEFNGFLKPKARLFAEPLRFAAGELVLAAGYTPTIDADVLATHELARERYSSREKH
jgi:L-alanine-DL-glutamate epimerase-like enolase superfamily enzyme